MDFILKRYQKDPVNKELEIRLKIRSWEEWKLFYKRACEKYSDLLQIDQTINILIDIERGKSQNRKEMTFKRGVKTTEKCTHKRKIEEHISGIYKYSLSEEQVIATCETHDAKLARLKLRASFILALGEEAKPKLKPKSLVKGPKGPSHEHENGWRIDFTFVWTIFQAQFEQLPRVKNKMFPSGKTIGSHDLIDFIESLGAPDSDPALSYEVELEYIGDPQMPALEITSQLEEILQFLNPESAQVQRIYSLAKIWRHEWPTNMPRTLKQFTNQPIGLTHATFAKISSNLSSYYLSDKADGERALLVIDHDRGTTELILSSTVINLTNEVAVPSELFKSNQNIDKKHLTIADTEVIFLDINKSKSDIDHIYIFDLLMLEGKRLDKEPFSIREKEFEQVVSWFDSSSIKKKEKSPIAKKIQVKLAATASESCKQIQEVYDRGTRLYPIDGLIFTPADGKYFNMKVYKWKPPEKITIDFLIIKAPAAVLGIKPYIVRAGFDLYFLMVGIDLRTFKTLGLPYITNYQEIFEKLGVNLRDNYFPIQFSPGSNPLAYLWYLRHAEAPIRPKIKGSKSKKSKEPKEPKEVDQLHGHIGEFYLNTKKEEQIDELLDWQLVKMRPDRDIGILEGTGYGNNFQVAEETFQQFYHPLTLKDLCEGQITEGQITEGQSDKNYFMEVKSDMYRPLTKFNNFVKAQLIRQLEGSEMVIDLASGKGQDLFTYAGFGIHNLLFVDRDVAALAELNKRKYDLNKRESYIFGKMPRTPPNIYTKSIDLTENSSKILKSLQSDARVSDGVVINFAIHYLISDQKALDNLLKVVDTLLKPGGIFIFTTFNGSKIFDSLKDIDYGSTWDLKENQGPIKYSIKKLYDSDVLTEFGQKIGVIHPFSQGQYYEENLVNIDHIIATAHKNGLEIRQNGSFGDWLDKFSVFNRKIFAQLRPIDKQYASLYQYVSLWKSF